MEYFYRVPTTYLENDYKEIMIRFCLDSKSNLEHQTSVSVGSICTRCGYSANNRDSNKGSFSTYIRQTLAWMVKDGEIRQTYGDDVSGVRLNNLIEFQLLDKFYESQPTTIFCKLTQNVFDTIIGMDSKYSSLTLLKLYTYIRSHIVESTRTAYGFNKSIEIAHIETGVSRKTFDECLALFVEHGLFIKHITGGCYIRNQPRTMPNIYVLPDNNATENIKTILDEMKRRYAVDEFLPQIGNNFKKNADLSNKGYANE